MLVHGCFWHRHSGCRLAYMPKTRPDFWRVKFESNVRRDREVSRLLRKLGWQIVTVWECELADPGKLARRLMREIKAATR